MGDRANVQVKSASTGSVFLYTHWGGTELSQTVRRALARQQRWNDAQYLARIIFDTMTEGDHGAETGFGISAKLIDGDAKVLVVDCDAQTVTLHNGWERTFDDYIAE